MNDNKEISVSPSRPLICYARFDFLTSDNMKHTLAKKEKELLIKAELSMPVGENLLQQLNDDEFREALFNFRKIDIFQTNMKIEANWCVRFLNEMERRYMPPRSA